MVMKISKIIAVVGPTNSGKTALARQLAERFSGIIISADSRQVYRGLDVGTNKEGLIGQWQGEPARLLGEVPQLLVDFIEPSERFTLADWLKEARRLIEKVIKDNKVAIIVGGTGLYVSSLLAGYQPKAENRSLRQQLEKEPLADLQKRARTQGIVLNQSDNANRVRLIRALEKQGQTEPANLKPLDYYLLLQPKIARAQLIERTDNWVERNSTAILAEAKELLKCGVSDQWLEGLGLGYRLALRCVREQISKEEFVAQLKIAEHQYIRRQETWWRHHQPVQLVENSQEAIKRVSRFLKEKTS